MNNYSTEIKQFIIKDFKLHFGKGPEFVKVNISDHIVVIDIKGSLTTLENSMLRNFPEDAKKTIRYIRKKLFDAEIECYLSEMRSVTNIEDLKIENYMFDIDLVYDREIIVIICNKPLCRVDE